MALNNEFCVNELDKFILNAEHCDLYESHQDKVWLLKHLPEEDGSRFARYYIKMNRLLDEIGEFEFARRYAEHTGSSRHPQKIVRWIRHLQQLEKKLKECQVDFNVEELTKTKMGKSKLDSIKNIPNHY